MKRRDFTKGLVALSAAPALPLPALSKTAPIAGVATDSMYVWAQFITRVHDKCSPAMLSRLLKLDATRAESIYAALLKNGVVGPPDAFGISKATDPLYQEYAKIGAKQINPVNAKQGTDARSKLKSVTQSAEENEEADSPALNQAEPNSEHEPDDELDSKNSNSDDAAGSS